jgi:hypothetical protein
MPSPLHCSPSSTGRAERLREHGDWLSRRSSSRAAGRSDDAESRALPAIRMTCGSGSIRPREQPKE